MAEDTIAHDIGPGSEQSQLRLFGVISAAVLLLMFAGYWFFFRVDYLPLLHDMEPQDAADAAKVLEAKKIEFRFSDEGRTILVPSGQADKARVELVGSELPMRGQVGFELFNKSDMGLTDFAQKINYQRALQGELARTILLLDGIQSVRVHLGLPEQSLFRDEKTRPRASVALVLKPGASLTQGRVVGIQRLVAGGIAELDPGDVTVMDGSGRLVSEVPAAARPAQSSGNAMIDSYRERVLAAIHKLQPDLAAEAIVRIRSLPVGPDPEASATGIAPGGAALKSGAEAPRGNSAYQIAVRVLTAQPLDDRVRADLSSAIRSGLGLDPGRGDSLEFAAGWTPPGPDKADSAVAPDKVVSKRSQPGSAGSAIDWIAYWPLAALLAVLAVAVAMWRRKRQASDSRRDNLESFARQLEDRLALEEGPQ